MPSIYRGDGLQINESPTATNNFDIVVDNAGGMKIARGNHGATTQDILTIDSSGGVTSAQTLSVAPATAAGHAMQFGQTRQLGYAQLTASPTPNAFTTQADITGLTATVNVLTGSKVKITAYIPYVYSSVGTDTAQLDIMEGATILGESYQVAGTNVSSQQMQCIAANLSPTAGSHTYKLQMARNAGTGNISIFASANARPFIMIEMY